MAARTWLALTASSLLLAGCAGGLPDLPDLGGNDESSGSSRGMFAVTPDSADAAERAETMTLSTEVPDVGARNTGQRRGIARADCRSDDGLRAGYAGALEDLRIKAANDGADYLQVLGSGPLESRGFCDEDYYRIDGRGYRTDNIASGGSSGGGNNADSLTGRLEELQALRDRDLITEQEYQELRERVLTDPY